MVVLLQSQSLIAHLDLSVEAPLAECTEEGVYSDHSLSKVELETEAEKLNLIQLK